MALTHGSQCLFETEGLWSKMVMFGNNTLDKLSFLTAIELRFGVLIIYGN